MLELQGATMSEFEARPTRTKLERLVTALSLRTSSGEAGSGGRPELESCHYAAMLAGMYGERGLLDTAEHLLLYVYLQEPYHRKPLGKALLLHLAGRVLIEHPSLQTSGGELQEVVAVTLDALKANGIVTLADAERAGIKRKRWEKLKPVHRMALERIVDAEQVLIDHLSRACA